MKMLRVCLGLLLCFLFWIPALEGQQSPPADTTEAYLFFTCPFVPGYVSRINLNDTSDYKPDFISLYGQDIPVGIAVDGKFIYWTISISDMNNSSKIARANLDGTGINWEFIPVQAFALTVDEKYIYWTNHLTDTIGRANLDGTGINEHLIECPEAWGLFGVAVSGKYIYWSERDHNRIGRAELDENDNVKIGTVNQNWITQFAKGPEGVVVTKNHVYWTNGFGGYPGPNWEEYRNTIGRADIDGNNCEIWIAVRYDEITESHILGIAAKGDFIYWSDYYWKIGRSNLNKTIVEPIWWRPPNNMVPFYIAVTPDKKYIFEGFFSPIENTPTVNKANAGQAIPVKWRITDKNGQPISDPASFINITSYSVNCATFAGDPTNYVEEFAAGSSGLQYLGDGWWQFNWKTSKTYKGQCRTMKLTLDDKSEHTASFSFK